MRSRADVVALLRHPVLVLAQTWTGHTSLTYILVIVCVCCEVLLDMYKLSR